MKKSISILLILVLLSSASLLPAWAEESEEIHVIGETAYGVLMSAEEALEAGMDGKQVLKEMNAQAEAGDFLDEFQYMCENIAAYENTEYKKIGSLIGLESDAQTLDVETFPAASEAGGESSVYDRIDVSDKLRELIKNSKAHYCFRPAYWAEEQFQKVLGTAYAKFKPADPRPGYACVVIKKGAQSAPEAAWDTDEYGEFSEALNGEIGRLASWLDDDGPVLTGNPHLASTFWVFHLTFPFYSWYGKKEIKGFNLEISLTVMDATTKKTVAECKIKKTLPNRISEWRNGKAAPDIPSLTDSSSYESFVKKVGAAVHKERATAAANRKITEYNAQEILNGILVEQAGKTSDAWQKAIYESGADVVTLEGGKLEFYLRSYNPQLKNVGAYSKAEDKQAWLNTALENAGKYDLKASLTVEKGKVTDKSLSSLKKTVKSAAEKAQKAFAEKDMASALKYALFPTPTSGTVSKAAQLLTPKDDFFPVASHAAFAAGNPSTAALSALFYAQKSQSVSVKKGPHALSMACVGISASSLMSSATKAVRDQLAYLPAEERDTDPLDALLDQKLMDKAVSAKKNLSYKFTVTVDIDQLARGEYPESYNSYLEAFNYEGALDGLRESVDALPEFAAITMPKNGRISGGKSGTTVKLKTTAKSNPTYIQIRSESNNKVAATVFVLPGKQVSIKVPSGSYRLLYSSGPYWYGEEEMFSTLGSYTKSEVFQIKGKNYTHTFTVETVKNGDVDVFDANPADFNQQN